MPYVRIAELRIDPAHLAAFTAIVTEEMADAVRLEPGVHALHAVADRDDPCFLRFFEIYADEAAYHTHRQTPHFQKYVTQTQPMILERKLIDVMPVQLSAK
jgi:quinol monooxygenase YgiN